MLQKEIKDKILKLVYDNQGQTISSENVKEYIPEATLDQLSKAVESLGNSGLIDKPVMMIGGHFLLNGITSEGMEYVEGNLLSEKEIVVDGLRDTDQLAKSGAEIKLDLGDGGQDDDELEEEEGNKEVRKPVDVFHEIREVSCQIKGANVPPCFSVESLAEAFVSQLDMVSNSTMDNISMIGLFAPWGRGKTYFFNKVKEGLASRSEEDVKYDVVEFNAWKYQDTPAVWAYLFETILNAKCWFFRLWYTIKRNIGQLLLDVIAFSIPIVLTTFLSALNNLQLPTIIISSAGFILRNLLKHSDTALSLIRKYGKEVSFESYLGVQAEIEKELRNLLKCWICDKKAKKHKVLLYIEDIDRCESKKMIDLIESIRTVLEDSEIRKRLVVVCSIDSDKLSRALKSKYEKIVEDKDIRSVVLNQIDKLFVSSISLPDLDIHQEREFIEKLAGVKAAVGNLLISPKKINEALNAQESEEEVTIEENFSEEKIIGYIVDYLNRQNLILTPRQISNVYYRCVLALRLLMNSGVKKANKTIIEEVIFHSYEVGFMKDTLRKNMYGDIIQIVVPAVPSY